MKQFTLKEANEVLRKNDWQAYLMWSRWMVWSLETREWIAGGRTKVEAVRSALAKQKKDGK